MSKAAIGRLAVLSLLWGSVFLWIKISGYGFSPVEMVFVRLVLGAAVILSIGYAKGQKLPRDRTVLGHMAVAALLGNAVPWLLFAEGERTGSSNIAGIVSGTGPVWTLGAAVLLGTEKRLGAARIWGMVVGLLGVVLVAAPWSDGTHVSTTSVIYFALGAVSFGSSFAYVGRFLTGRGIPVFMLVGGQLAMAAVMTLVAVPFIGLEPVEWRTDSVIALVILGVMCTGFAVLLNTIIIGKDGPAAAATVIYLMTVVSVVLGAVFLDEPLGWTVLLGTVAVLVATGLLRRKPAEPAAPATSAEPAKEPAADGTVEAGAPAEAAGAAPERDAPDAGAPAAAPARTSAAGS
ncbi:DMT family transporter [Streptomyces subrutilus]|uniref:Multidrug transporter n=1 Tax=Streptomyces subrutilus TaxID=36818 RepID=A0A918QN09_9ACTN|nr:DMT family transporter [Streptomyces subrutilus]WSJ32035.1 DMT family transporter [Streptomyces subrutilus]GGZ57740.1 multidrug transporter [Streptomyces subrutilus]